MDPSSEMSFQLRGLQDVVFSECSAPVLLEMSSGNRSIRKMCHRELSTKRLDVAIVMTGQHESDRNSTEMTMMDITDQKNLRDSFEQQEFWHDDGSLSSLLVSLLKYCRVETLTFAPGSTWPDLLFMENFVRCELIAPDQPPFKVDTLVLPLYQRALAVLPYFSPRRVVLTSDDDHRDPYYGDAEHSSRLHFFAETAMLEAMEVEIDERNAGSDESGGSPVLQLLRLLRAPSINIRERSRMRNKDLYTMIRQWQAGRREILSFYGCVGLSRRSTEETDTHDVDSLLYRTSTVLFDASETPPPSYDVIPRAILDQFQKTEDFHGDSGEPLRAMRILHSSFISSLILLVKELPADVAAAEVAMFPL